MYFAINLIHDFVHGKQIRGQIEEVGLEKGDLVIEAWTLHVLGDSVETLDHLVEIPRLLDAQISTQQFHYIRE